MEMDNENEMFIISIDPEQEYFEGIYIYILLVH